MLNGGIDEFCSSLPSAIKTEYNHEIWNMIMINTLSMDFILFYAGFYTTHTWLVNFDFWNYASHMHMHHIGLWFCFLVSSLALLRYPFYKHYWQNLLGQQSTFRTPYGQSCANHASKTCRQQTMTWTNIFRQLALWNCLPVGTRALLIIWNPDTKLSPCWRCWKLRVMVSLDFWLKALDL